MALQHITDHMDAALDKINAPICRECRQPFLKKHVEVTFCKDCLIVLGKVAEERAAALNEVLL